jgi:hypothetical protein
MLCRLREALGCVGIDDSISETCARLPKALPTWGSFDWAKRRVLIGIASTMAVILTSAHVFGQAEGANRQSFNLKGSLMEMQRGLIKVAVEADKKEYIVKLPNEVEQVRYSGQAVKEWLGPGMFIRFDIQMDEKGKFVGTVKQVEVFMPDPKLPNNPENMKNNALGVHPLNVPGAENLFSDEKKSVVIKTCRVVARVGGVNKNKLMAIAGNSRVQVELDDNVAINVAVPGVDLFQAGDDVTVSGFVYPDQPGWVEAARVAVVGKQPIGQKPAKGTKANARTRRDKKEPAAEKNNPKSDAQAEKKEPEKKESK